MTMPSLSLSSKKNKLLSPVLTLGTEGWQIGPTTLTYANGELSSFAGHTTLDKRGPSDSEAGRHCDTLEFIDLPVDADLSQLSLSVQSVLLAAAPEEGHQCEYDN